MICKFQQILVLYLFRLGTYVYNFYEDLYSLDQSLFNRNSLGQTLIILFILVAPPLLNVSYLLIKAILKERDTGCRNLSQKTIEGLLLVLYQIKKYLDNIFFAVTRIGECRPLTTDEEEELENFERGAEFKEYFEDFFGAFPMLCLEFSDIFNSNLLENIDELNWHNVIDLKVLGLGMAILSMMIAIHRRDDGPFFKFLSFIGWLSMFTSRVILFSVAFTIIGPYFIIPLSIHVLFFTVWVYNIAIDSFRSERIFVSNSRRVMTGILVLPFFGIASLFLWPIMFQLKEHNRPKKFLLVIVVENLFLMTGFSIWFLRSLPSERSTGLTDHTFSWVLLASLVTTAVGSLFIYTYACLKPYLTDRIVRHDNVKGIETKCYGVYYEFFEILFNLPRVELDEQVLQELRSSEMHRNLFGQR